MPNEINEIMEIERLALFSCKGKPKKSVTKKKIFTSKELRRMSKELEKTFRENIAGEGRPLGIKNIEPGEYTRIHSFSDQSVLSIFRELLVNDKTFEDNAAELARRYCNAANSREAVIFVFTVKISPHRNVIVYSSKYLDSIAGFSEDRILEILEEVFDKGVKKGIIYPCDAPGGKLDPGKAKVHQTGGYATYWWKAFGLNEELSDKEILEKTLKKTIEEGKPNAAFQFDEKCVNKIADEESEATDSEITLSCSNVKISVRFNQLYKDVIPAKKNGEERIVIKGGRVSFRTFEDLLRKPELKIKFRDYDKI